jgi:hypothetical protein
MSNILSEPQGAPRCAIYMGDALTPILVAARNGFDEIGPALMRTTSTTRGAAVETFTP